MDAQKEPNSFCSMSEYTKCVLGCSTQLFFEIITFVVGRLSAFNTTQMKESNEWIAENNTLKGLARDISQNAELRLVLQSHNTPNNTKSNAAKSNWHIISAIVKHHSQFVHFFLLVSYQEEDKSEIFPINFFSFHSTNSYL